MRKLGFVYHPIYLDHDTGIRHPERKARLESITQQLEEDNLSSQLLRIEPFQAATEWITEIHDIEYIKKVENACQQGEGFIDNPDTPASENTYNAALMAVGGVLAAIDNVMKGTIQRAFCSVRPPGHHAEQNSSMGFCFFNNIAIGARYLQKKYQLNKIFILDWDVHHGNGTQHSFERDSSVFFSSLHEDPRYCYPGSGAADEIGLGPGEGFTLNCPIQPGTLDEHYYIVFEQNIIPAIKSFRPDFILISAGFDAHTSDPIAHVNLTEKTYTNMTHSLSRLADEFCHGRIISVLEGGYDLKAIGNSVSAHIKALLDD